jgi:hypothetical protein
MPKTIDPFRLLLISVAGWMNHRQQQVIDYLREENRILHAQLSTRRLRFDDTGAGSQDNLERVPGPTPGADRRR